MPRRPVVVERLRAGPRRCSCTASACAAATQADFIASADYARRDALVAGLAAELPLAEVQQAHRLIDAGQAAGKLVLMP